MTSAAATTPTFAEWRQASDRIRRASGLRLLSLKAAWAIWFELTLKARA